ncbi:MAG: AMP-binding protein, partial [Deltaproteobacteria bacterium]
LAEKGIGLYVMYGQTEASPRMTCLPQGKALSKIGSCGLPLKDARVEIRLGEAILGPRQEGEIVFYGPNVMMGYANGYGDLSLGDNQQGQLETGDIGYLDEDGYLFITGRKSRFSKIVGKRVSLDEIEQALGVIGSAAAINYKDENIVICFEGTRREDSATMLRKVEKIFKLPSGTLKEFYIEQFPRNVNGKIDYPHLLRSTQDFL